MKNKWLIVFLLAVMFIVLGKATDTSAIILKVTYTPTLTRTSTSSSTASITSTSTNTPTETPTGDTPTPTDTATETLTATITDTPIETLTPTSTPIYIAPYPSAPLCPDSGMNHDNNLFHTLWDSVRGCHYDHEHGTNPFTSQVNSIFPDIQGFLNGIQVGTTNPTSSMENSMKHGGFKWDVVIPVPHTCVGGFEGATYCVQSAVIEYHNFGDYSMEFETRNHSTVAFLKVCDPLSPSDCGLLYTVQHQEYGQRIVPYQGTVISYPNNFVPEYGSSFGQYFSVDCIDDILPTVPQCRPSISFIVSGKFTVNSIWTSKPTMSQPNQPRPSGSTIFKLLFRIRDLYQVFDWNDFTYPFTFRFLCGDSVYNPVDCSYNNSTTKVHEVAGTIPSAWDNLEGFDVNSTVGRITANGFTDRFGTLDLNCTQVNDTCFPIKLVNMFVGNYGDYLTAAKVSSTSPTTNPERDIYFCNAIVCSETSLNAVPSGWIGSEN
jgi:hypothetical protein